MPILPIEKFSFKFAPSEKDRKILEDLGAELYSDNFKVLGYKYNNIGKRILLVTDRVSDEDVENYELLSTNEVGAYDKLLSWAITVSDSTVKSVVAFNWPFAKLKEKNSEHETMAKEAFFNRLVAFVKKWEPDGIVLCGSFAFEFVLNKLIGYSPHKLYANRVLQLDWNGYKCPTVHTIDLFRPISWDNKYTKAYPPLLGYLGRGISNAIDGLNKFEIKTPSVNELEFVYIDSIKKFKNFYVQLNEATHVSIDSEGASLRRVNNTLFSVQFCWNAKTAYFVPLDHPETPFTKKELDYIKGKLRRYFERGRSKYTIYQNAKFDIGQWIDTLKIRFYNHKVYDIQAGAFALDENRKGLRSALGVRPYALEFIAEQYGCSIYREIGFSKGNRKDIQAERLPEKGASLEDVRKNNLVVYACYDVIVPYLLAKAQIKEAAHYGNKRFMTFVLEYLSDNPLAFSFMEHNGIPIDETHLQHLRSADGPINTLIVKEAQKFAESKACQAVNKYLCEKMKVPTTGLWGNSTWLFDINKPKHQQILFFKALQLEPVGIRKDGGGQVNKAFQEKYSGVPEVAAFNGINKVKTLRNNFVNTLWRKMQSDEAKHDRRMRARFGYTSVVTGRTSVVDPNTQNVPTRGYLAKIIKRLYAAIVGCLFLDVDYSAHEVRDWANESKDMRLAKSFYVGLKYRQELRLIAYSYPEEAEAWTQQKEKRGWYDVQKDIKEKKITASEGFEKFTKIIDGVNDDIVKSIAKAEFALDIEGDVHKLNCQIFYQVPVLEVTDDQRQDIKAVVFGTIYGKTPAGLATSLKKTEDYAQELQDTLFSKFSTGANWLKRTEKFGQKHLYVESPLGMQRHLWGYLHNRQGVINGMNRRGPNSILQGVASCIGISSIRIMQKLVWHYFVKHGHDFTWQAIINYVHDSVKSETSYHIMPIALYLTEHASTTLIHRRYKEIFNYELTVGLELEFQLGATQDRMTKWNFMKDNLFSQMETEMKWKYETFGHPMDMKSLDIAMKNWDIIADLRKKELQVSVKSKEPVSTMLMTQSNARSLGLITHV